MKAIAAGTNKVLFAALLVLGFMPLSASEARIIGHTKARSSQAVLSNECPKVAARALLGGWTLKNGEGQFEDMVFEAEPRHAPEFRSYLHMRPDFWGSWSLKTCRVTIAGKSPMDAPVTFTILSLKSREMRVRFGSYAKPGIYKRV